MINDTDIKHELDHGDTVTGYSDDAGVTMDTPRSWDSGVALDSVTALQMAEFQAVVDNLHRQVVSPVRWESAMAALFIARPADSLPRVFECGPGKSLSTVLGKINGKASKNCQYIPC